VNRNVDATVDSFGLLAAMDGISGEMFMKEWQILLTVELLVLKLLFVTLIESLVYHVNLLGDYILKSKYQEHKYSCLMYKT
jgi:hypothetical protein